MSIGAFFGFFFAFIFAWMQVNVPEHRWFANTYILMAIVCWLVFSMEWVTDAAYPVWDVWGYHFRVLDLAWGSMVAMLGFTVAIVMSGLTGLSITAPYMLYQVTPSRFWSGIITGICVPFYEETLFLAIVPATTKNVVSIAGASEPVSLFFSAVVGGLIFAIFHWLTFQALIPMLLTIFIFRVLTVIISQYRGGIGFAVVAHIIINLSRII